ncbi:DUF5516 domain-containing protein [Klebsiella pneumoniae]
MGLVARGLWMLALIIKQIVEHKPE